MTSPREWPGYGYRASTRTKLPRSLANPSQGWTDLLANYSPQDGYVATRPLYMFGLKRFPVLIVEAKTGEIVGQSVPVPYNEAQEMMGTFNHARRA